MFKSAYLTTTAKNYILNDIKFEIEKAIINNTLLRHDSGIYLVTGLNDAIPLFSHPLEVKLSVNDRTIHVIDVRQYTKTNRDGTFTVKSKVDFEFNELRVRLEKQYSEDDDFVDLLTTGTLPLFVYTTWISEAITSRLGLDPESQLQLMILTGFFYISNHTAFKEWKEKDIIKMATKIANATNVSVVKILEVASEVQYMENAAAFIDEVKNTIESSRIKSLNVGLLFSIITSSSGWRGPQAKEIIAVSIEHAPTWHAVVKAAINERTFIKSSIAKTVKRIRDSDVGRQYTLNLGQLVR